MASLRKKGGAALAALLCAALPVTVASASPAAGPLDVAGSVVEWLEGWADGWLARLVPGRATAGAEAAPAEPPTGVAPDDESMLMGGCGGTDCTGGRSLPDFDPDG